MKKADQQEWKREAGKGKGKEESGEEREGESSSDHIERKKT